MSVGNDFVERRLQPAALSQNGQPPGCSITSWPAKIETTVRYLGEEVGDALRLAEQIDRALTHQVRREIKVGFAPEADGI
jgi:hypothetical protein